MHGKIETHCKSIIHIIPHYLTSAYCFVLSCSHAYIRELDTIAHYLCIACRFYSTLRELSPPVFVLLFSVHSNNRSSSLNSRGLRSIQYINKESKLLLFLRRYLIKLGTKNHEAELRQILSTKGVVGEKI